MRYDIILKLSLIVTALVSGGVSALFTPLSIKVAKKVGAIDTPKDDRRMHTQSIPRLGGMAIFISALLTIILLRKLFMPWLAETFQLRTDPMDKLSGVIVGAILIYALGMADDIHSLKIYVKLIAEVAIATIVFLLGARVQLIYALGLDLSGNGLGPMVFSYLFTVVWIVAITNMINLIDGLDGLAAGVTMIASIAIAFAAYIHGQYIVTFFMIAIAGAALGFLPFNFYPAKTFMGDGGALLLGFLLASGSIIGETKSATVVAISIPVLVLGVPIFDVVFAILRRVRKKESIFSADRGHLHHQLANIGMGQRRATLMIYGISSIMGVAAIILSRQLYYEALLLFLVALLFIFIFVWDWNKQR